MVSMRDTQRKSHLYLVLVKSPIIAQIWDNHGITNDRFHEKVVHFTYEKVNLLVDYILALKFLGLNFQKFP